MNVTYIEKDKVLNFLCKNCSPEQLLKIPMHQLKTETGFNTTELNIILSYFNRIGLIAELDFKHLSAFVRLIIYTEAFDVFNRGGFTVQENMLQKEVEKLLLEIERLKPSIGDKIEQITTIANNIASIFKPIG